MKLENLRSLIRESINEYIREIDDQGTGAMYQAKKQACEAAIEKREAKLRSIEENEELKEMVDATKLKDIQKEINELRKYHKKLDNLIQKHANKGKKKEVVSDTKTEEAPLGEADVTAEMDMSDDVKEEALNESFLKMQKLAGLITESEYNKKKSLIENKITDNPEVNKIETQLLKFFNTPKVTDFLKKELQKLSPEKQAKLKDITQTAVQEGESDMSGFEKSIEKAMDTVRLNEDLHDTVRSVVGGYKPGEEPTVVDKTVGKILTGLGVVNIMSMGFLPSLTAMAIDAGFDINLMQKLGDLFGSGQAAVGASVLGGLLGGGLLWKIGKILQNEKTTGNTPLFENTPSVSLKQDPNINLIKARLKLAIPQLKINDTTPEFETLITSIADMIQSSNNSSLTDQEILTAYRRIIANKTKNMSKK
jgi:hypothetical protein